MDIFSFGFGVIFSSSLIVDAFVLISEASPLPSTGTVTTLSPTSEDSVRFGYTSKTLMEVIFSLLLHDQMIPINETQVNIFNMFLAQ